MFKNIYSMYSITKIRKSKPLLYIKLSYNIYILFLIICEYFYLIDIFELSGIMKVYKNKEFFL